MVSASRNVTSTESVAACADLLGVVRELGQQHAARAAIEIADRQVHDALEDLTAQPLDDVPADIAHAVGLGEIAEAAQQEQTDQAPAATRRWCVDRDSRRCRRRTLWRTR